jgi:hypothetical protein
LAVKVERRDADAETGSFPCTTVMIVMTTMIFIQPSSEVYREVYNISVRCEVLTAVVMNVVIFWDIELVRM